MYSLFILMTLKMHISEGSRDTEDWSNEYFAITGTKYILKYIKINKILTT